MTLRNAPQLAFWPRDILIPLLPALTLIQLFLLSIYLPLALRGIADLDFRTLYASGYLVRTGHGADMYDTKVLQEVKENIAPIERVALNQPMDHPAYEALLFVPLSLLRYPVAMACLMVINAAAAVVCICLLFPLLAPLQHKWAPLPALLVTSFFPVTKTIAHGQDSILLLALFAGAFRLLRQRSDLSAGVLIGLGLFKFQIVVPVALIFLLWRRWGFLAGFGISSFLATVLSLAVVGFEGFRRYVSILLAMSLHLKTAAEGIQTSTSPTTMVNLRGLLWTTLHGYLPHWWLQALIIGGSLGLILLASKCPASLAMATLVACIASYHLNSQDMTVLLIPIGFSLSSNSVSAAIFATAVLAGSLVSLVPSYGFLCAIPLLGLLVVFMAKGVPAIAEPALGAAS